MSLLVEMWAKEPDPVTGFGIPCCRSYETLDNPMRAKVTRIIKDPQTGLNREFTSREYVVNPKDIEQRNSDRYYAKVCGALLLVLAIGVLFAVGWQLNRMYEITITRRI